MRGLDPRIHQKESPSSKMDCRVKPGNDGLACCHHSTPIVVRSWNQCCACTNFLVLGDSACGLVSCTTHTSTASSTICACACASNSSCLVGSKVCLASSISASTFGFLYPPQLTPTGAIWPEWKKRTMAYSGSEVT